MILANDFPPKKEYSLRLLLQAEKSITFQNVSPFSGVFHLARGLLAQILISSLNPFASKRRVSTVFLTQFV